MASIVDVKPSLCCRLPLRNAPRLLVRRRAQDSLSTHTHHARSPAKGSTSKIYLRGSIAPKAMMSTTATALASISSSTSALPALALSPAVLSWAFALATIHAAALVLLVRDAFSLSLSFIHHEIAKKKRCSHSKKQIQKKTKQMALAPRARLTSALASRAEAALSPLCALYLALLVTSWSPDTMSVLLPGSLAEGLAGGRFNPQFFPALAGVAELFSRPATAASVWVHLLVINLFAARSIWARKFVRGGGKNDDGVFVAHSVLLAGIAAPLGLLADAATRAASGLLCYFCSKKKRGAEAPGGAL